MLKYHKEVPECRNEYSDNDCAAIAISNFSGYDYDKLISIFEEAQGFSVTENGTTENVVEQVLRQLKFVEVSTKMTDRSWASISEVSEQYGAAIILTRLKEGRHLSVVVSGTVYDQWDSRFSSGKRERKVMRAWTVKKLAPDRYRV